MKRKKKQIPFKYETPDESSSVVNEPEALLEAASLKFSKKIILTGTSIPNDFDLIDGTRRGVHKAHLYEICQAYDVTLDTLCTWLHTSYRNIARKQDDELLDPFKSEKLLALGTLASRGIDAFGSADGFRQWVHAPLLALGNKRPIDYLDTTFGIQMLHTLIARMEWGIVS
jgi:putative toxin-antitoxin system antitoxin component (TIGR02293 family)